MEWAKVDPPPATHVFEFQKRLPGGRNLWEPSYIRLVSPTSDGPTLYQEYTHADRRWRVWAITQGRAVGMSAPRALAAQTWF